MRGRVRRKQLLRELEAYTARAAEPAVQVCALCSRRLGERVQWHHVLPKSEGGTVTVPVHPICHRAIHAHVTNHELAGEFVELDALRQREDIRRFLQWIANKPPDFSAPTRKSRAGRDAGS